MPRKGGSIGQALERVEDARLLRGLGRYSADLRLPGACVGLFLRSPHAHARIAAVETARAAAMPGVLAVLTADDAVAARIGPLRCGGPVKNRDGSAMANPARPILASGTVRFVGDPMVLLVAESLAAALDAAEAVTVDYEPLPAVCQLLEAVAPGAPQLWPEAAGNLCFDWGQGDQAAMQRVFDGARHVVSLRVLNNRIVPNSMEPRVAVGTFDPGSGRYGLTTPTQGAHIVRGALAKDVFACAESDIHVVTPDVGGGFGMKLPPYPEQGAVLWAARHVGRPVRWVSERTEAFLADTHGRDQVGDVELALDGDGRMLGLRISVLANLGAYLSHLGPFIPSLGQMRATTGPYHVPQVVLSVKGVFTNTAPTDAYRGAGRPEAIYMLERMVDTAARMIGLDPAELRRRNFVPSERMPYRTAVGQVYDSGDFQRSLDQALARIDRAGFAARRAQARQRGRLRGLGLCCYVDPAGGNRDQFCQIRIAPDASVTLMIGSQSTGQGHETAYAQIAGERLGIAPERIRVVQGDTDRVGFGRGTSGSRSIPIGGPAVLMAADSLIDKGRTIAAHLLQAERDRVAFHDGAYVVEGTDRSVPIEVVANTAYRIADLPEGLAPGFDAIGHFVTRATTYPNGTHACELEIDPETGVTTVVRYLAVDDFGRVINPMLVEGQLHGGIAQGIGQALLERCLYDSSGQLVTASYMDYALPRADDLPPFELERFEIPCLTNALGVKGCGEAGAIAAPPAVANAALDALWPLGVRRVDMPLTPERVWRLIQDATAAR